MARNEEKAQSMLYRFREAQAAELGITTKTDRRPRLASSCQDLRQCERWRGEILREISRKVSKIQDAGLTDYEVRDLNDEINKLLREKSHWETQIINLGGANYRRIGSSTFDGAGRSAPGQQRGGYKYFGRAKELPGVKELFEGLSKHHSELDSLKKNDEAFLVFKNQGPGYFGDLDEYGEEGEKLLSYELEQEKHEWEDSFETISKLLGVPEDQMIIQSFPRSERRVESLTSNVPREKRKGKSPMDVDKGEEEAEVQRSSKRQAISPEKEEAEIEGQNRRKENGDVERVKSSGPSNERGRSSALLHLTSVLDPEDLKTPPVPTTEQWEKLIMDLQKAALLKQYIG
ncbi:Isy1-like splicing factor [Phakopsora pachyrhizi]|nr:Isy1-like splicing factor [Phakopsora pachyrhizi]